MLLVCGPGVSMKIMNFVNPQSIHKTPTDTTSRHAPRPVEIRVPTSMVHRLRPLRAPPHSHTDSPDSPRHRPDTPPASPTRHLQTLHHRWTRTCQGRAPGPTRRPHEKNVQHIVCLAEYMRWYMRMETGMNLAPRAWVGFRLGATARASDASHVRYHMLAWDRAKRGSHGLPRCSLAGSTRERSHSRPRRAAHTPAHRSARGHARAAPPPPPNCIGPSRALGLRGRPAAPFLQCGS